MGQANQAESRTRRVGRGSHESASRDLGPAEGQDGESLAIKLRMKSGKPVTETEATPRTRREATMIARSSLRKYPRQAACKSHWRVRKRDGNKGGSVSVAERVQQAHGCGLSPMAGGGIPRPREGSKSRYCQGCVLCAWLGRQVQYPDAKSNREAALSSCQSDRYVNAEAAKHRRLRGANDDRANDDCNEP